MKKYRQVTCMLAILTFVLTTGISTAYANSNEYEQLRKRDSLAEKQVYVLEAFEKNDYGAWKSIIGDNPISRAVTENIFDKFINARELARKGDYDSSFNLSSELGGNLQDVFTQINVGNDNYYLLEQVNRIVREGQFEEIL
jgi:hypothetical protein